MSDDNTSAIKTCRKTPWDKVDIILLFFLVASIITLIVTVTCVWYPYLETSSFIYSQCRVIAIHEQGTQECVNPPDNCVPDTLSSLTHPTDWTDPFSVTSSSSSLQTKTTLSPTSSSISNPAATNMSTSIMTSLSTSTTLQSSSVTRTTTIAADGVSPTSDFTESFSESNNSSSQTVVRRKRRQVTPSPPAASYRSENLCPAFPCYSVTVFYSNYFIVGLNVSLLYNYYQLQTYPSCAYSSCDSDNEDNAQAVAEWIDTMENYKTSRLIFGCYGNVNNGYQVIQTVNFTYSSGVNSIFWPILSLIGFFFALLFHRCRKVTVGRSSSNNRPPPEYDADCQVNYNNLRPPTIMTEPVYTTPPDVYGAEGGGPVPEKNPEAMGGEFSFYGRSDGAMSNPWPLAPQPPPYLELVADEPVDVVSAVNINMNIANDGELRY